MKKSKALLVALCTATIVGANADALFSWFGKSAGDDGNPNTNGNGAYSQSTTANAQGGVGVTSNTFKANMQEVSYDDRSIVLDNKTTLFCIVNATKQDMQIDHVGGVDNGDWDGPNPHTILLGTLIPRLQSICKRMIVNTYHSSAPIEPFITINGTNNTLSWRTDQFDARFHGRTLSPTVVNSARDSNPGDYKITRIIGHSANTFFITDKKYDNPDFLSNWMAKIPADTKLKDVMMVGSHDAGVAEDDSIITFGIGGYGQNTITQHYSILNQLKSGSRFFDLRVDTSPSGVGLVPVHSGNGCISGIGGAYTRKTLDSTMDDVVSFIKTHQGETVFLSFSHHCNNDDNNVNVALLQKVLDKHNTGYYYTAKSDESSAVFSANLPINKVRGKIVILLSGGSSYEKFANPESGYFVLQNVYDDYANKATSVEVEKDQLDKLNTFAKDSSKESDLFMLNWTITRVIDSIQAGSGVLNPTLAYNLARIGTKNPMMPNIVNLDFVNPMMGSLVVQRYYQNQGLLYK